MKSGTLFLYTGIALAVSLTANAQSAQTPVGNVSVLGHVSQICVMQEPVLLTDQPSVNVLGLTGQSLQIAQLTDPNTLAANPASFGVGFTAVCNFPNRVTVESQNNGLFRDSLTPPAPGFADGVPYSVKLEWGSVNQTFQADGTVEHIADFTALAQPAAGQIKLRFTILAGASNAQYFAPLLAGTYRDIVRVTLEPQ